MKYKLGLLFLAFSLTVSAQKTIYFDNRDSSVVKFFKNTNLVDAIARENEAVGLVVMQFAVLKNGNVQEVQKIFAADELLYPGLEQALLTSSGKWTIRKGVQKQKFQISVFVSNVMLDSTINTKRKHIAFYDTYKRMVISDNSLSQDLTQLRIIFVSYPFAKYKRNVSDSPGVHIPASYK